MAFGKRYCSGFRRLLEGIGSSRQVETHDGSQIVAMSDQMAKLTAVLPESKRRRLAEQESMSATV